MEHSPKDVPTIHTIFTTSTLNLGPIRIDHGVVKQTDSKHARPHKRGAGSVDHLHIARLSVVDPRHRFFNSF